MINCVIILLGATGDLAKRKIIPALYHLFVQEKLGNSIIIGAALSEAQADQVLAAARQFAKPADEKKWQEFGARFFYRPVDFMQPKAFDALATFVAEQENLAGLTGNRLVYCAVAPFLYCAITNGLAKSGLVKKNASTRSARTENSSVQNNPIMVSLSNHEPFERTQGWQRIVYEKPFGNDLQSAHAINTCIASHFDEQQIYRVDHYLTKELVTNIALVRFTNIVFEPLWNNRYIDHIQIVFDEELALDGRGIYYDKYGALADVMQNHMMQLVALIGMESPEKLTGDFIRAERAKVLARVKVIDALLGQYEGYTKEPGVAPNSKTETFAQVMLRIDNPRWAGVPFYLRTGKCLNKKETAIYIAFKHVDCLLAKACPSQANYLAIQITPKPLFSLTLNAKKPGKSYEVMPVQMHFSGQQMFEETQAYEVLFQEIAKGEQSVSVRFDEIEYAWKIIDAVRALKPPVYRYECGSKGPTESKTLFDNKHGVTWKA